jgi:hypothetical protein
LSAFKAKANNVSLRAKSVIALSARLFNSLETAINSTTLAPPYSSNGWYDIKDYPETALRIRLVK